GGGRLRARRQGRRGHAPRADREVQRRGLHRVHEPARAPARDARLARVAARRPALGARARPARGAPARPRARRAGRRGAGDRVDLPRRRPRGRTGRQEGLGAVNKRGPSVLAMIALVAVVVALVILVFFALGYAFGRAFL